MTTHILTAPEKKGVSRWLFDPSSQETQGGRYFNPKTGIWYDRGYKKWDVVLTLIDVDELGNKGYHHKFIRAPYDGYVHGLPREKCYFKPGEAVATFDEDYVYHWRFHGQKHKRGVRVRTATYRKFPRVLYGLNFAIAVLIGVVAYLLTLIGWEYLNFLTALMLLVSLPYSFFSGLLMILGKEQGHRFLKDWFEFTPFWCIFYGVFGLGLSSVTGYEILYGSGFSVSMFCLGFISLVMVDSMLVGAWGQGPILNRFTEFLKKRILRQKKNGSDT